MSHSIQIPDDLYDRVASYATDHGRTVEEFVSACLALSVEQLVVDSARHGYNPAEDPIAQFIGAFDSGDQPPLQPHEHDRYFVGEASSDDARK